MVIHVGKDGRWQADGSYPSRQLAWIIYACLGLELRIRVDVGQRVTDIFSVA